MNLEEITNEIKLDNQKENKQATSEKPAQKKKLDTAASLFDDMFGFNDDEEEDDGAMYQKATKEGVDGGEGGTDVQGINKDYAMEFREIYDSMVR